MVEYQCVEVLLGGWGLIICALLVFVVGFVIGKVYSK